MKNMQITEVRGIRVLTTKQLAEAYETSEDKLRFNFKYNRNRFVPGKHFILIEGDELKELKREFEFQTLLKQAKSVCFWTEKGALLHAKSVNTDKAWEVYDYLVDFYFRVKEQTINNTSNCVKTKDMQVVNIPINEKEQELIAELRKEMAGMECILKMYNRYMKPDDYQKVVHTLRMLGIEISNSVFNLCDHKPTIIEKVY